MNKYHSLFSQIARFFSYSTGEEGCDKIHIDCFNAAVFENMDSSGRFISLNEQTYICGKQIEVWYGDILSKVSEADAGFIYAKNDRSGQMGTVHTSLLCPVIDQDEHSVLPYFHPFLLPDALNALKTGGKGTFLIKPCPTHEISYFVLLTNVGTGSIQQFLIKAETYGYVLCGRRFPTIGHMIDRFAILYLLFIIIVFVIFTSFCRYCSMPIIPGVTLSRAVLYSGSYLPLSSAGCYSFSGSDMNTISMDYQNVASVEILWKYIPSHIWKKGRLLVWKMDSDNETLFEIKASRNFVFKSSESSVYPVDDALFGRFTCAFVKNSKVGIFLNFRTVFELVYCVCTFRFSSPKARRSALHVSLFSLCLNKFRSYDLHDQFKYSAHCCVDDVQLWSSPPLAPTSCSKSNGSVVFDQTVLIPFMPDVETIELSVLSHSDNSKEGYLFRAFSLHESCDLVNDPNESLDYQLSIRRIPVLESCCYESFTDWILNCPMPILVQVSDLMTSQEKNFFCVCVTSHFLFRKKMLYQILRRLITYSLETSSFDNILRQDSLTTTFLSQMLQVLCRTEFIELIREELRNCSTEVIEDETHINLIIKCLNSMVSQNEILRNILVVICQTTNEIYPDSILLSRKIISVILVLRFACPLLLKDNSFPPNVVKQVQMIANKSLSSSDNDNGTVLSIRDLFDGIAKLRFKEETSELYTFPWHGSAALACYMLNTCISRKLDLMATLPLSLKNVLKLHKPF